jgi:hypothetical protein
MVIVLEFGEGEEFKTVVLSLIDEDTEVLFELLVDSLRLSITLRVVCGGGC